MAKNKPTKTRQRNQSRQNVQRFHIAWNSSARIIEALIKWGFIFLIAYFVALPITKELAGKNTVINTGIDKLIELDLKDVFLSIFGLSGIVFGARSRSLMKAKTKHLAPRVIEDEREIDPGRSSSYLLPTGDSNMED